MHSCPEVCGMYHAHTHHHNTIPNNNTLYTSLTTTELGIAFSTVRKIALELKYLHAKPWYTDVLTPAQKYKRKLFCARLLRMSDEALFYWLTTKTWTDEKWYIDALS